jgi:hypothetical protein
MSLKEADERGFVKHVGQFSLEVHCPLTAAETSVIISDVLLSVTLAQQHIQGSPTTFSSLKE